jgi:hypothetical protein
MNLDGARNAKYDSLREAFKFRESATPLSAVASSPTFVPEKGSEAYRDMMQARKIGKNDPRELIGIGLLGGKGHNRNRDELRVGIFIQKNRLAQHPIVENIQTIAKGECKIIYTGRAGRQAVVNGGLARPLRIGCSISHHRVTAGTLGAFAINRTGGGVGILSNNHVLADTNKGRPGDVILQPGKQDGGGRNDRTHHVATLHKFVPIDFSAGAINFVDCAFAYLMDGIGRETRDFTGPQPLDQMSELGHDDEFLEPDVPVKKVGRTTGLTHGFVQATEVDNISVNMVFGNPNRLARFDGQIVIAGRKSVFSKGGDSGSLILTDRNKPVGLLFAGTERGAEVGGLTYAHPIQAVLDALDVDIYVGP